MARAAINRMPPPRPTLDEVVTRMGRLEMKVQTEAATILRHMPDPTEEHLTELVEWLEVLKPPQPISEEDERRAWEEFNTVLLPDGAED